MSSVIHTTNTFHLSFCSNEISHFFCDISLSSLCLALTPTSTLYWWSLLVQLTPLPSNSSPFLISSSQQPFLKTESANGRGKGFSTCASHLIVVSIYHGTLIFIYLRPSAGHSLDIDKVTSVFYTLIIPMLNPWLQSEEQKDVKNAFRK